jgi:hypothetical protein
MRMVSLTMQAVDRNLRDEIVRRLLESRQMFDPIIIVAIN